jgi:succinate dehydrogenase / fumarate reductase cytochrome b subunit
MRTVDRPLSPHLQIFRPWITMVTSIVHRITGCGLYFGMALFSWWLMSIAVGGSTFASAQWFFGSWLGLLVMLGFTWALMYHLIAGIRHLVWDTGRGLDLGSARTMAWMTIVLSIVLTVVLWVVAFAVRG